mmetsp:Transcript_7604/g.9452  ORF Transcript_7604/g.9452 Transcript_7604/m.9452 type:complete len:242 (-) Transcript_7604:10-735(-)
MNMDSELDPEPLPSFTAKDVQDAHDSWETKSRDDKMQFLMSIPMRKDSNLKQNEAAIRAILGKAETDTDLWVQRLAMLLGSVVGTTTVSSSEVDKKFLYDFSKEVSGLRVRENALLPEALEYITPDEAEEEEYRRQCSSPLAPAAPRDAEVGQDPEESIRWLMEEAEAQFEAIRRAELAESESKSVEEPEAKRQRTDPFQTWGEVSRPQAASRSSSSGAAAYSMDTFTAADVRDKWEREQK